MLTSGLFIVDKPKGMTSHDVVDFIRRLSGIRKVGHTGTLDPMATGVLPVCFGKATKLVSYLVRHDKSYRATLRLGEVTETGDADSPVLKRVPFKPIPEDLFRGVMERFVGEYEQIPPMYSAVKVGGIPLYKRARAGEVLTPPSRKVTIHHLSMLSWEGRDVSLEIDCSKGTYVRRLCSDIGEALGVGAHVVALRRLRSGPFDLKHAVPLDQLTRLGHEGRLETAVTPMTQVLNFPRVRVSEAEEIRVLCGAPVRKSGILSMPEGLGEDSLVAVHNRKGEILALAVPCSSHAWYPGPGETPIFKVEKVLSGKIIPNGLCVGTNEPFKRNQAVFI